MVLVYLLLSVDWGHQAIRWKERFEPDWWIDAALAVLCLCMAVREAALSW